MTALDSAIFGIIQGPRVGGRNLFFEVQCKISESHMGPPPMDRQTDTTDNIKFLQLC